MSWEYMVREFNVQDTARIVLLEEFLNEVGNDGWELISVATTLPSSATSIASAISSGRTFCKEARAKSGAMASA